MPDNDRMKNDHDGRKYLEHLLILRDLWIQQAGAQAIGIPLIFIFLNTRSACTSI